MTEDYGMTWGRYREALLKPILRTCTLLGEQGSVTIGWANVASYRHFRDYLADRMLTQQYGIIEPPVSRTVIYNQMLKINEGVSAAEIRLAMQMMGAFVATGDVSILRISQPGEVLRLASTPQEVLDNDTFSRFSP